MTGNYSQQLVPLIIHFPRCIMANDSPQQLPTFKVTYISALHKRIYRRPSNKLFWAEKHYSLARFFLTIPKASANLSMKGSSTGESTVTGFFLQVPGVTNCPRITADHQASSLDRRQSSYSTSARSIAATNPTIHPPNLKTLALGFPCWTHHSVEI